MSEEKIKVAFIGQASAGKTSLILKMVQNTFDQTRISTIGVQDFKLTVNCENQDFLLNLLDTAGQEKYGEITDFYIKDCDIIIICFDPVLPNAEDQLKFWKGFANRYHSKSKQILVSTKSDLWSNNNPLPELVRNPNKLLDTYSASIYFETSAQNGNHIEDLKNGICHAFLQNQQLAESDNPPNIKPLESADKKCSC